MTAIGWLVMPHCDWGKWRLPLVAWTSVAFLFLSMVLVLEALFKESSPSRAIGIESAFLTEIPALIKESIDPGFDYQQQEGRTPLESVSQAIVQRGLLKRNLIITTSKLPVDESNLPANDAKSPLSVNTLPDDLYFYYSVSKSSLDVPPLNSRFISLRKNPDKLLDVVIGSSTIYPIFPARLLNAETEQGAGMSRTAVLLGSDDQTRMEPVKGALRVIDGGFIHNIPVKAAADWGATHIIVIEASPAQQQLDPRDFWDHSMMAFGYLFSQAQRSDSSRDRRAETFVLRPTSECEKLSVKTVCTVKDSTPVPDMDTFDFSRFPVEKAFEQGGKDVKDNKPLFERVPGDPIFRNVSATTESPPQNP
jgi:hypothetical protein